MEYVLVTGCNGFIGSKLTEELLKKGYYVLGLSLAKESKIINENFKYISVDLTDRHKVENIFSNYNISSVVHLAAIAHLKNRKKIEWDEFYKVNTLASKTVFECAINKGAKIFFASTVDIYGSTKKSIVTEECKPNPMSDYAKSKLQAEMILNELSSSYSFEYVIGRFAPVYAKDFMKDVYKRIYLKYPNLAFLIGNGYNYHFVSVHNVVDFIINWLEAEKKIVGTFNICDQKLINSKEFIELEKKAGNIKRVIYLPKHIFGLIKIVLLVFNKFFESKKLNTLYFKVNKLINPERYSLKKMKEIYRPKWDLKSTVYQDIED